MSRGERYGRWTERRRSSSRARPGRGPIAADRGQAEHIRPYSGNVTFDHARRWLDGRRQSGLRGQAAGRARRSITLLGVSGNGTVKFRRR
jgi:hypothetical protein